VPAAAERVYEKSPQKEIRSRNGSAQVRA